MLLKKRAPNIEELSKIVENLGQTSQTPITFVVTELKKSNVLRTIGQSRKILKSISIKTNLFCIFQYFQVIQNYICNEVTIHIDIN